MTDIIAHRGRGLSHLSENTIESMEALGDWVAGVEIDPRLSSDGVPVLMHDPSVDRTTNGTGDVADLTAAELTQLWAGNGFVPTLEDYLDACSGRGFKWIILDTKETSTADLGVIWDVAQAAPADVRPAIIFGSESSTISTNVRAASSTARIARWGATSANVTAMINEMAGVGGELIFTESDDYAINRDVVATVHSAGLRAGSGRNNNLVTLELARADGCDVVLTDRADDLADWADTDPDDGQVPVPVAPPPIVAARIETGVSWCAVNDRTGQRIADLPDASGATDRLLMAYTSGKATVPLASLPVPLLEQATVPQQTSIVQVVNGLPVWSGRILIRSHDDDDLILATATPEQYLLQRRVTTRSYMGKDRAGIAVELLSDAGSTDLGSGMGLEVDAVLTGDTIDRRYLASDQTTVYAALRELAEAGTLEWTIDLEWADTAETRIRRIIRLRDRIGQRAARPPLFETATGTKYTLTEDFSTGRYANHVVVYGDGEGEDMPRSDPAIDTTALAGGTPIVEAVLHIRDATTAEERNALAQAELARLMHGVKLWDLDCPLNQYPRLGYDIGLGDWGAWDVEGPRHPTGAQGQGRVIGWGLDAHKARWQPKLLDPHEEVAL